MTPPQPEARGHIHLPNRGTGLDGPDYVAARQSDAINAGAGRHPAGLSERRGFVPSRFLWRFCPLGLVGCLAALTGCERLPQTLGPIASPVLRFNPVGMESGVTFVHGSGAEGSLMPYQQLGAGCAVFDFNNDGWLDLYFPQGAPAGASGERDWSNRLYQGGPGWRWVDVTRTAGVGGDTPRGKLHSIGCAVGDWNNDGFDDLLVTGKDGCLLYQNGKNGTFSDVTAAAGLAQEGTWTSATFIDYDRDSWLDLYVCRYDAAGSPLQTAAPAAGTSPLATASGGGRGSRLYRNVGGARFRDVTVEAGVQQPHERSLGVIAADLNNDGWPDLCVANDGVRSYLFQNDRGSFVERGREAGIAVDESGVARPARGVVAGSLTGDAQFDLLFTQGAKYPPALFRGTKQEALVPVDAANALPAPAAPAPGWGCAVGDLDLDGLPDCITVAGSELTSGTGAPGGGGRPRVLLAGSGGWKEVTADMGRWFQEEHDARGAVLADLDKDGDLDLVVTLLNQPPVLLRNEQRLGNHWYQLTLVGTTSNLGGLGARVTALTGGRSLMGEVHSSSGFATAGDRRLCFGLGTSRSLDGLEIRWPSGAIDVLPAIASDRSVTLKEGGEVVVRPPSP